MRNKLDKESLESPPTRLATGTVTVLLLLWAMGIVILFHEWGRVQFWNNFLRWLNVPSVVVPEVEACFRHGKRLIALACVSFAILGVGHRTLSAFGICFRNIWDELVLSFAFGYGFCGSVLFVLGVAGYFSQKVLIAALAISLVVASFEAWVVFHNPRTSVSMEQSGLSLANRLVLLGIAAFWLRDMRVALVPETFYDALQYHLALPNSYLLAGRIHATPENSFSGIPGLPQMLYGLTLAFDEWGITARLLHHSIVLWVGVGFLAWSRRLQGLPSGILAITAFLTAPVVAGESFRTSVGMEGALFELCCFLSLLEGMTHEPGSPQRRKFLLLSGALLGFAMATKYTAWLLPIGFLPALFIGKKDAGMNSESGVGVRVSGSEMFGLLLVAALFIAPWVIKNIVYYKNPIFPFLHALLAPSFEYQPRAIGASNTDLGLAQIATLPVRFLVPPSGFHHSIGIFCVGLLPLVLLVRLSPTERLLGLLCMAAWLPLAVVSAETRFFIPHLAMLTILLASLAFRLHRSHGAIVPRLAHLLCIASAAMWIIATPMMGDSAVFSGKATYSEYLRYAHPPYPTPPFAGIEFINAEASLNSRVMLYREPRAFYLRRRYLTASSDQPPLIEVWANKSQNMHELKDRVDREGIDYILINLGEIARQRLSVTTSERGLINLGDFWRRYTSRVFGVKDSSRWVGVYKVLTEEEARKPHATDDLFGSLARPQTINR